MKTIQQMMEVSKTEDLPDIYCDLDMVLDNFTGLTEMSTLDNRNECS